MIGEILRPADTVLIRIEAENREWGYNPYPDNTKAMVIGPTDSIWGRVNNCCRLPGIYPNHSYMRLILETGKEVTESSHRLHFEDPEEEERRSAEYRKNRKELTWENASAERIGDLPETPFWEWDQVEWRGSSYLVRHINFRFSPDEMYYSITPSHRHGSYDVKESELKLISRGKIWQYYNGEPVQFSGIGEEDFFFQTLERYDCVVNPRTGHYGWGGTHDCIEAVLSGAAHSYTTGISPYGIRFIDEDLGKRVAEAIKGGYRPTRG